MTARKFIYLLPKPSRIGDLATGWGFAPLLETSDHTLLFETGADGQALLENMRLLGKDPARIEAIVISHAHSDHTGGLPALLELGIRPTPYLLQAFPASLREMDDGLADVVVVGPGQKILPGVSVTGQVGASIPEQALVLSTPDGIVLLTGCAHPGAVEARDSSGWVWAGYCHFGWHPPKADAFPYLLT